MEDISPKNNFIKRSKKKKATVNESVNLKKKEINLISNHIRSNSEHIKNIQNKSLFESGSIYNLITKGPSINKLFFKNDNISLKSGSMPKANKKQVKKFRSINIDKGKNEIINNITIKKKLGRKYDSIKNNPTLNYYNMDYIEKLGNLKGVTKDFISNNNMKKSKKPNYINKNYISNDKLVTFNSLINTNPIYDFYSPLKDKEIEKEKIRTKKPIQKIQSVNQEKREYKFSDFKIIKNAKKEKEEEDDDESLENINPDDYREGNNIQLIEGNSFSEENDESSSLSSENIEKNNYTKKKKTDKLSNLINKSMKNKDKQKIERWPSQNYSDGEDNYFINDTKIFMSPKINSKHPSNKSLKSDGKSDYFNSKVAYFNDATNNNDSINKNSFLGGPINKSRIRKFESLRTNSNYDYEGENDEGYDLVEMGNKLVNNLNINDSYINIKSNDISLNNLNPQLINSDNNITNLHVIKNINMNENLDNSNNNNIINHYNLNNNMVNNNFNNVVNNNIDNNIKNRNIPNINRNVNNYNNNLNNINNINSNLLLNKNGINMNEYQQLRNYIGNINQSNIINIHNMNNFNNNNFIIGNENSGIPANQINHNLNNSIKNFVNNNNINIPQKNIINEQILNKNNFYQGNNNINEPNYNIQNYLMNKNNIINQLQINQLNQNNQLINENNNQYINIDLNNIATRNILNNPNYLNQNINNNMNINFNSNINNINNVNNNLNKLYNMHDLCNLNDGRDIPNNNVNINYLKYFNSQNNLNNEINNNILASNNLLKYNQINQVNQMNNQNVYNNFQNQNVLNQYLINLLNKSNINNQNYINQLKYNNYINQNNNVILSNNINNLNNNMNKNNNINLYSNVNGINNPIIPNNNINVNNPNINNIDYNDNFKMTHSMGNLNHLILQKNANITNSSNRQNNHSLNKQKNQNLNLLSNEELAKQAYNLAKYQNGCRYLQKRIENNQKLVPTLFFPNILGHIQELSNDQFGNYYIKIIIKYLPEDMIYKFIQLIHPSITKIGTNQYGTKVIQNLIDFLTGEKNLLFFIEKTLPHVVDLINDLNGIHIIQRLICIKSNYIQMIYNKIFENVKLISVTRDGSNFIKKLLDFLDEENMVLLINSINENLHDIITNQFGNYIIQNIIKKENLVLKFQVIETIILNIVNFSNQKFSSNVVEKCFEVEEMKDKVIDEIIKGNNFEHILLNEYGNYVIQKALFKSDQNRQHIMFKLLVPIVTRLQSLSFGQKLLSKLFILYPRLSIYILNSEEQL